MVLQNIFGVNATLDFVTGNPSHRPREILRIRKLGRARGNEELRDLLRVQIFMNGGIRACPHCGKNEQDLVTFDKLANLLHGLRWAVGVVIEDELDLAATDSPLVVY